MVLRVRPMTNSLYTQVDSFFVPCKMSDREAGQNCMKFNLLIGNEVAQPLSRRVHCATLCAWSTLLTVNLSWCVQIRMRTICTPWRSHSCS